MNPSSAGSSVHSLGRRSNEDRQGISGKFDEASWIPSFSPKLVVLFGLMRLSGIEGKKPNVRSNWWVQGHYSRFEIDYREYGIYQIMRNLILKMAP